VKFSLVSAPVLGFDLVRHPQGEAVASVLLRALTCGPEEIAVFTAAHARLNAARRDVAWQEIRTKTERTWSNQVTAHPALAAEAAVDTAAEQLDLTEVIIDLRERMIVDLDDIAHLIDSDVLAWCTEKAALHAGLESAHAADPFVDAIASLWPVDLDRNLRQSLAAPFLQAARALPMSEPDVGPQAPEVQAILTRLGQLSALDRDRLRATVAVLRPPVGEWSQAMHEASWAAFTTGRIRAAAAAQLLAVQAFAASGLDATDGAEGVWNAISGHVHATVVADVLPDAVRNVLADTWRRAIEDSQVA
jgi:hypothetical protein